MEIEISEEFKLNIVDHILDSIYGHIGLTKLEKEIEKLSIFKRLHDISQLGLTNIIFPCALHNRYVHSIGVMHMAGEMASHINVNMQEPFFCDSEIQIIRLAGLLHDIGHYPMSHNIESSYIQDESRGISKRGKVGELLEYYTNFPKLLRDTLINSGIENKNDKKGMGKRYSGSVGFHHEKIGSYIITSNIEIHEIVKNNFVLINGKLNPYFSIKDKKVYDEKEIDEITNNLLKIVGEIIIGNYECNLDEEYKWAKKYSAMIQLIHSDMDADNLDYLLRDATFSGTTYGLLDISVLLNSLFVRPLELSKKKTVYLVGVLKKGIGSVEQFMFNKMFAYKQMIYSKYVSMLESMLFYFVNNNTICEEKYNSKQILKYVRAQDTNDDYLQFNDSYIKNKLYEYKNKMKSDNSLNYIICEKLVNKLSFNCCKDEECVCTSNNLNEIKKTFMKNRCYKEFATFVNKNINRNINDLNSEDIKILFSYRFEKYNLTKQLKYDDFKKKFVDAQNVEYIANMIYYRFADGIPVFDNDKYYIDNDDIWEKSRIPKLCVDMKESLLYDNCDLMYISLRKYEIE